MTDIEQRRKRLIFRAQRRGFKEADLIFAAFAAAEAAGWSEADIAAFEALLEAPDHDAYAWLTGHLPLPAAHDTPLFARLLEFCRRDTPTWIV